jgi:predicted ATPase
MKRCVLTGGSRAGKSTVLNELERRGFVTVPEAAQIMIQESIDKYGAHPDDINEVEFLKTILLKRLELEEAAKGDTVFIDRGIFDGIAYARFFKAKVPEEFELFTDSKRYHKVFLLEMLPTYEQTEVRRESPEMRETMHSLIKEAYAMVGYKLIFVPVLSVEERADFILQRID